MNYNNSDSFINAPALKTASDWLQFSHIFKPNIFLKPPNLWKAVQEGHSVPEELVAEDDTSPVPKLSKGNVISVISKDINQMILAAL